MSMRTISTPTLLFNRLQAKRAMHDSLAESITLLTFCGGCGNPQTTMPKNPLPWCGTKHRETSHQQQISAFASPMILSVASAERSRFSKYCGRQWCIAPGPGKMLVSRIWWHFCFVVAWWLWRQWMKIASFSSSLSQIVEKTSLFLWMQPPNDVQGHHSILLLVDIQLRLWKKILTVPQDNHEGMLINIFAQRCFKS